MARPPRYSRRSIAMYKNKTLQTRRGGGGWEAGWGRMRRPGGFAIQHKTYMLSILGIMLLALFISACSGPFSSGAPTPTSTTTQSSSALTFPTTALALRTPAFGTSGQVAPTVKVLASADPSLIVQFPLVPVSIKSLFPHATGLVTVVQGNPQTNDFDTLIVDV